MKLPLKPTSHRAAAEEAAAAALGLKEAGAAPDCHPSPPPQQQQQQQVPRAPGRGGAAAGRGCGLERPSQLHGLGPGPGPGPGPPPPAFPGGSGGDLWVLLSSAAPPRLPVVPWGAHPPRGRRALRLPALQLLRGCMRADPPAVSVGLLGLQHRAEGPGGADGLCLNVLLSVEPPRAADGPPPLRDPEWRWGRVEEEGLKGRILQRVRGGGTVPIRS